MIKSIKLVLLIVVLLPFKFNYSQCTNSSKYPNQNQIAPKFVDDTLIVSIYSYPGEYFIIQEMIQGKTYEFRSTEAGDYFTIRGADDFTILKDHGSAPKTYTVSGDDILSIHLNLTSPNCGTNSVNRTISVVCTDCPVTPPGIGIGTNSPSATLEVDGEIKIGDVKGNSQAGMIRWNATISDFEGFNGSQWVSLTQSSNSGQWGTLPDKLVNEDEKLIASDGTSFDKFGTSVAISGDYAVIGAKNADISPNIDQGAVYVFKRNGNNWSQLAKLTASNGDVEDFFGRSVAIWGDYIVVGSPFSDNNLSGSNSGSVYVYHRSGTTWNQQAKLLASDTVIGKYFGSDVAIEGDYIVIGAEHDNIGTKMWQGSAYIFKRSGSSWVQQSKIIASDGSDYDQFGRSVAINNDHIIVGAPGHDIGTYQGQGAAYIFLRSGLSWGQQAKLLSPTGNQNDYFGSSVHIDGTYAIIGSPYDDIGSILDQGSVSIFLRNGTSWSFQKELIASDGEANEKFGSSVKLEGSMAIIGSMHDKVIDQVNQGSAYIFERDNIHWYQKVKLLARDGRGYEDFGTHLDIDNNSIIIGCPEDKIGAYFSQGSAYIFTKK